MTNMPENTDDFRELLNEKFKSIHTQIDLQFGAVKASLEAIEAQTKKTNGRVTKLEEVTNILILKDATHQINCPQASRLKAIEEEVENYKNRINADLQEYNFFKKYPKIAIGAIAITVVVLLFGISELRGYLLKSPAQQPVKVETTK